MYSLGRQRTTDSALLCWGCGETAEHLPSMAQAMAGPPGVGVRLEGVGVGKEGRLGPGGLLPHCHHD